MEHATEPTRRNAMGHLVPESLIKPIDLLRDEVVRKQVASAKELQLQMQARITSYNVCYTKLLRGQPGRRAPPTLLFD